MCTAATLHATYDDYITCLLVKFGVRPDDLADEKQAFYASWIERYQAKYDPGRASLKTALYSLLALRYRAYFKRIRLLNERFVLEEELGNTVSLETVPDYRGDVLVLDPEVIRQELTKLSGPGNGGRSKDYVRVFDRLQDGWSLRQISREIGYSVTWVSEMAKTVLSVVRSVGEKLNIGLEW